MSKSSTSKKLTLVIGATASGKTTFIENNFVNKDNVCLNVYDYQQSAYREAGFGKFISFKEEFKCLYKANENLLTDIIENLQPGKNVVVEQTLFKAKRRIAYIDKIRETIENVKIEVYVMCPSDATWESYIAKRKLEGSFQSYKSLAEQIEFPNPAEGIDRIFQVVDGDIELRMDEPTPEILDIARKELVEEAEKLRKASEKETKKAELLESFNTRPFWHYCESCGKKEFITAKEAFDDGWDYPPTMGSFGLLSPRTCGDCGIEKTLFWKIQQQEIPIVIEKSLSENELKTWKRIKNEPESLLKKENV